MKFRHILLTTDLSPEAERAFAPAQELARAQGARITLLHVVPELSAVPHGAPLAPPIPSPETRQDIEEARELLRQQREKLDADLEVCQEVMAADNLAHAIDTYAEEHEVDLICLSTHGRTGFRRLVLGSVAEAVLRHAKVPVLCFPRVH